jgi:hypothetical protein
MRFFVVFLRHSRQTPGMFPDYATASSLECFPVRISYISSHSVLHGKATDSIVK